MRGGRLAHVRWIGGGSGAGTTTLARRLAARRGAILYDSDAAMAGHAARCPPDRCPGLAAFRAMDMDERWLRRSPARMLDTFHWFRGEAFDLIEADLRALPADRPILAEGFRLLPARVAPHPGDPPRAVWLLPTPAFRRRAFAARGTLWDVPNRTSDPPRALANLLARDALFTERLRAETAALGLSALAVDGARDADALLARIDARPFGA